MVDFVVTSLVSCSFRPSASNVAVRAKVVLLLGSSMSRWMASPLASSVQASRSLRLSAIPSAGARHHSCWSGTSRPAA